MVLVVDDYWVYPFLKVLPPPVISVFFAACFFVVLGIYFLGKKIAYWRWKGGRGLNIIVFGLTLPPSLSLSPERHLLIEELRL